MEVARVSSAGLDGIDAYEIELEVSVGSGGNAGAVKVVGLPDAALREARDRVRTALLAGGYPFPVAGVTVNLAPAHRRKEDGAAFDLPIALGILAAAPQAVVPPERLVGVAALGELTLGGAVRPVRGALAAGQALARAGLRRLLVPRVNARAAALGAGGALEVLPVDDLAGAVGGLTGVLPLEPYRLDPTERAEADDDGPDLAEVRGQAEAKRALRVAAAGGHDLLLVGPPGTGKTMLARRLPGLLPPLRWDEVLEVSRIHAAAGGGADEPVRRRPFRAPHHTASYAALVGGGPQPRPGEVSLAHRGVLFLDELPEFHPAALEALREPLETRSITLARSRASLTFPCDFALVAAMNPCPCGYLGDPRRACRCEPRRAERYAARVSGPLADRIDIRSRVGAVPYEALVAPAVRDEAWSSARVRAEVVACRALQQERQGCLNARLEAGALARVLDPSPAAHRALADASARALLSGRGLAKVQRLSRTLADLAGRARVEEEDVARALHLRLGPAEAAGALRPGAGA